MENFYKKIKKMSIFKVAHDFYKKNFARNLLPIVIILLITLMTGVAYAGFEYYTTSAIIKVAEQLTKEEKYNEAIEKLEAIQNKWIVNNLRINKALISNEIEKNKKFDEDKSKYDNAIDRFNEDDYQVAIDILSLLPDSSFYYQKAQTKIEESKRKMLEGELSEEQKNRKVAEAKAKQEEFEKELKEKELLDKEAKEKMMNADNDGDTLTYERELELGTSDWNADSDGDGIKDNKDLHPAGGGRYQAQTFSWSYGGDSWTFTASIHEDWYQYYKSKTPRPDPLNVDYVTYTDPFIKTIAQEITTAADKNNINKTALAKAFVQSLSYVGDEYTGYDEYPKYPIETFFEKNGDCEDMSYLTAAIVRAMNIDTVLVVLPGHMAVGFWIDCDTPGTYYKIGDRCYYYTETTAEGWVSGKIPDTYKYSQASLIKIPSGEIVKNVSPQYNKPCEIASGFPGYYFDGKYFYTDNQCNYLTNCVYYKEFYVNPQTKDFYWNSACTQLVVKGCSRGPAGYSLYFCTVDASNYCTEYYFDSMCTQKVRVCRYYYSDTYYDGYDKYWDSTCTQKKLSWCVKSLYKFGYFFNSIDYNYYYDSQCTQKSPL